MTEVLAGVRVVEIANWAAAPGAGALMADLGAEVVKIEPLAGDAMRGLMNQAKTPEAPEVDHPLQFTNRGKKSVAIALNTKAGAELVFGLAAKSDIVITNLLPHRRERLGLTVEALQEANPQLIIGLLTGYGEDGPDAGRPGYDLTSFFASSGLSATVLGEDGSPAKWRAAQGDYATSLSLFAGVMAALHHRAATDRGQVVETSLLRTAAWTNGLDLTRAAADGRPANHRSRSQAINPAVEAFQCSDGRWIQLTIPEPVSAWQTLCAVLEVPHLLEDPRFDSSATRFQNMAELMTLLDAGFAKITVAEAAAAFEARGASYAIVKTTNEVVTDPQTRAAGVLRSVPHHTGKFEVVASPFTITSPFSSRGDGEGELAAYPPPGADTAEVLTHVLEMDASAVEQLAAEGVIGLAD